MQLNVRFHQQVNIDGVTGSIRLDKDGMRTDQVELEILNLRNNSFITVSCAVILWPLRVHVTLYSLH